MINLLLQIFAGAQCLKHRVLGIVHLTAELYSSNLYLQMAFWFRKEGWKGFAAWMFDHSNEEKEHALKMANFVLD